jgi:hypothetical protein
MDRSHRLPAGSLQRFCSDLPPRNLKPPKGYGFRFRGGRSCATRHPRTRDFITDTTSCGQQSIVTRFWPCTHQGGQKRPQFETQAQTLLFGKKSPKNVPKLKNYGTENSFLDFRRLKNPKVCSAQAVLLPSKNALLSVTCKKVAEKTPLRAYRADLGRCPV